MLHKIMIVLLVIGMVIGISSLAPAAKCVSHKDVTIALMKNGYGWLSTFITSNNMVVQLFIKPQTAEWVMINIDESLQSCVVSKGTDWVFAIERVA